MYYSPKISFYISGKLENSLHNYIEHSENPMELSHCKPEKRREKRLSLWKTPEGQYKWHLY